METVKTEPKVTEPAVDETTKTEEMIPQSQVNGIVAKETKQAIEKLIKDLGVEDVKSAKDGLSKLKEMQEAQKTETEKLAEKNAELEETLTIAQLEARTIKIEMIVDEILTEMEIDKNYKKTILKLTDVSGIEEISKENLQLVIETTIKDELPMLIKGETLKVGVEATTTDDKIPAGTSDYLKDKYKKNPYFKG
jgi:hypothetical protein